MVRSRAGFELRDDACGGHRANVAVAGKDIGDDIERGIENADFRRAGVGAGMLNHLGDRHVVGIAERGRERDGHCAGVVGETPQQVRGRCRDANRSRTTNAMYSE